MNTQEEDFMVNTNKGFWDYTVYFLIGGIFLVPIVAGLITILR